MIRFFSANYILPVTQEPIRNGIVSVTEDGKILGVYKTLDKEALQGKVLEQHEGIIVPGFVNSHSHLELAHLHGKINKGKGLLDFIRTVPNVRQEDSAVIIDAMERADASMFKNGIVAVGDICNTVLSKKIKEKSSIYYHNYVEIFGFDPEKAKEVFDAGVILRDAFAPFSASIVPHAAYSVCKDLFRHLQQFCRDRSNILSIHNQESEDENKFFRYKIGDFVNFYKDLGLNIEFFKPQARDSIQSIMPLLSKKQRIMLVHNIYTSLKDISFVNRFCRDVSWCFCPNSNLYIGDVLPKLELFLSHGLNICLGTDSLASNDGLCMLSELKTIHRNCLSIPLTTSIAWATLNGAKHLGIDAQFGSIDLGKKPGLNLITGTDGLNLTEVSTVQKLI